MRITITEAEIKLAITNHIEAQGFNLANKQVEIDLKATRGPEGYSADIDITNAGDAKEGPQQAAKPLGIERKVADARSEPATEDNKPETETEEDAAEAAEAEAETETQDADQKPAGERPSIFANMKKPVNTKETADA